MFLLKVNQDEKACNCPVIAEEKSDVAELDEDDLSEENLVNDTRKKSEVKSICSLGFIVLSI